MSFIYDKGWANSILHLSNLDVTDKEESQKLDKLIMMAEDTKDDKVIIVLIKCICYGIPGFDTTVESILSSVDYSAYYTAFFKSFRELASNNKSNWQMADFLEINFEHEDDDDGWETIEDLIRKYLSKKDLEILISGDQGEVDDDFKEAFERIINEEN